MHTFKINALIQYFTYYICFETPGFIIRKKVCKAVFMVCLYKCMKNMPYKTACTNGLPDDGHMMFETCRRHEESKQNLN